MKRIIVMSVMSLCMAASAFAKDIKKVVFTTTPQMHCDKCENKIKGNLRFEKGVKDIETDIKSQSVTITYDADKTDTDKLQTAFSKIGYKADIKPTAKGLHGGVKARVTKNEDCDGVTSSTQQAEKQSKKKK